MKILANRKDRLLAELARGFRRGTCLLLDNEWLVKHGVTLTECYDLSEMVGNAIDATIQIRNLPRAVREATEHTYGVEVARSAAAMVPKSSRRC